MRAWDWWLLGLMGLAAASVFAVNLIAAEVGNRVFIGADGVWANDQLQYLAWATDAGHHWLSANLYALHLGGHVFLHPVWLLTGLLHVRAGLSYPLLMAGWKLAALLALFVAVRAYVQSLLGHSRDGLVTPPEARTRALTMLIALFMVSPGYLIADHLKNSASGIVNLETFSIYWINGYFPIALAVAAMLLFLMQCAALTTRDDAAGASRRRLLLASIGGLAAAWLHPWQGMILIVIIAGLVVWERPSWRRHSRLLLPLVVTAAPLVYYAVLPSVDAGWKQSQHLTASNWGSAGVASVLVTLLPIVILMLPGYAVRARSSAERMLFLWPPAVVAVYLISPSDKFHAIGGGSVAAAVLMVRGWPWVRRHVGARWPAGMSWLALLGACVAVAAAPVALVRRVITFRSGTQRDAEIARGDSLALDSISRMPTNAGVLTTSDLGAWVPVLTDHATWTGHPTWTPRYVTRTHATRALFDGSLNGDPARARSFIRMTAASIVLAPCGSRADLRPALLPAGWSQARYGCATLYRAP